MTRELDLSSELAEARRRLDELESLVEISPVAIVVMDADERVTGWNPAAAQLFGYSRAGGDRAPRSTTSSSTRTSAKKAGTSTSRRSSEVVPTGSLAAHGRTGSWSTSR